MILKFRLFYSSYVALLAILALRVHGSARWCCLALAVGGVLTAWSVLRAAGRIAPGTYTVQATTDTGSEVSGYLATYLVPFVTVPAPTASDLGAAALFLLVVAIVYVRSEMVQINPTLYLLGWRVTKITTETGWTGYLISQERPLAGQTIRASRIRDVVLIGRGAACEQ